MRQGMIFDSQIRAALTGEPQTLGEIAAKCGLPVLIVRETLWGMTDLRYVHQDGHFLGYALDVRLQETAQ